jgi:DNA-binding NarL/FixJ family response regulator
MALQLEQDDFDDEGRLVSLRGRPEPIDYDRLVLRWESALSTFRSAVESYNTVLSARARWRRSAPAGLNQGSVATQSAVLEPATPPSTRSGSLAQLTRRETEVAHLIMRGLTNRQIADALVITQGTAANHVAHVLDKLNASNRTQVAMILQRGTEFPPDQFVRDYSD